MFKTTYKKIGNIIYPVTYTNDGLVIIDYPEYDPELAKKITDNGKKKIRELLKKYSDLGLIENEK